MARKDRGFASMHPKKQHEIASRGGVAAHVKGTAHEWNSETARIAGRKGAAARAAKRANVPEVPDSHVSDHELATFAGEGNPLHE